MKKSLPAFSIIIFVLILNSLSFTQDQTKDLSIPDGFVDLKKIIPTIVHDMRYFSKHNFIGEKIEGYHLNKCVLSEEAARALEKVQKDLLKFSLSLKIYDAYRPQHAVDHFVRWAKDLSDTLMKKEFYPTVEKKDLFSDGYIASKSSHSRGSTVDLTIVPMPVSQQEMYKPDKDLCECYKPKEERYNDNSIDMGNGYDCFHPISHTENKNIEIQQRINRLLLKTLMEKHGFKNYPKEWWHFTLKNEPYPNTYFDFPIE